MGHWIPFAGILMLVLFFIVKGDVFHWTHHDLYTAGDKYDKVLVAKSPYFFWPLGAGGFPLFFIFRMVAFFGLWYMFFTWIKKEMLAEDIDGSTAHWYTSRKLSAIFLVIFGYSSSIAAWDWVMSIDAHWFSTMMGWYVFASWWVTGLATIALIVVNLKDAGYLKVVTANHLHDLGKFIFAFSIFWTYIWFSQFLLIYYANIPEETIFFRHRMHGSWASVSFVLAFGHFIVPFFFLMPRSVKRNAALLSIGAAWMLAMHLVDVIWLIVPTIHPDGLEVGLSDVFAIVAVAALFKGTLFRLLSGAPLVPVRDPRLTESLSFENM